MMIPKNRDNSGTALLYIVGHVFVGGLFVGPTEWRSAAALMSPAGCNARLADSANPILSIVKRDLPGAIALGRHLLSEPTTRPGQGRHRLRRAEASHRRSSASR